MTNKTPEQFYSDLLEEEARTKRENNLGLLAGAAAGLGAGYVGMRPYDAYMEKRLQDSLIRRVEDFDKGKEILRTLHKIRTRQMSWNEVPESDRAALQEIDRSMSLGEIRQQLAQRRPAELLRPNEWQVPWWKRWKPSQEALSSPFRTMITHPLPTSLAALGTIGGTMYANWLHKKRMEELLQPGLAGEEQ